MIRKSLEERISIYVLHMLINTLFIWEQNGLKLHYPTSWQYPLINYLDLAMPLRPSIGTLPPPNSLFTVCIRFKQENANLPEAWEITAFSCMYNVQANFSYLCMYAGRKVGAYVYLANYHAVLCWVQDVEWKKKTLIWLTRKEHSTAVHK